MSGGGRGRLAVWRAENRAELNGADCVRIVLAFVLASSLAFVTSLLTSKGVPVTDNTAGSGDSAAPLRIGILGAGMIATTPYGVLPNMAKLADKAELVSIADPVTELAKDASRRFGIPEVYDGIDAMLAQSDI